MIAVEFSEPVPSQVPTDAAILDLGYEVAFPFLASPPDEAVGQMEMAPIK